MTPGGESGFSAPLRLGGARLALFWERLWPALWPISAVAMAFAALSLLEIWSLTPQWLHGLGLALFAAASLAALALPLRRVVWPSAPEGRRRLETASDLAHRPLTTVNDRLASAAGADPDPLTRALWQEHHRRTLRALRRLRIGWPVAGWLRVDPWGARAGIALVLLIGLVAAGSETPQRLADAFRPGIAFGTQIPPDLDAWISPPDYTGLAPTFLTPSTGAREAIRVPAGSVLFARVHGARGVPELVIDGEAVPFEAIDGLNYQSERTLDAATTIAVNQRNQTLAQWPLRIIPDRAPGILFDEPPSASARQALRLSYAAEDDYGVVAVEARIRRTDTEDSFTFDLPLPLQARNQVTSASFHDLTPHPWAGFPVLVDLAARDEIGQTGHSKTVEIMLPERQFDHPVARAIIEQRRVLALRSNRQHQVARALERLSLQPQRFYDDSVVFLSLRAAVWRLTNLEPDPAIIDQVVALLWDTALRIEDGELALAEAALRAAQDALQEALDRNAPDSEIDRRIQELREALDRFLRELAERALADAQRSGEGDQLIDPDQLLRADDLQRLLDRAQELSQSGARDAARELLSQLREMLENLREGLAQGDLMPGNMDLDEYLQDLNDLLRGQQELLDDTFRRAQEGQRGPKGEEPDEFGPSRPGARQEGPAQSLAERQERLRRLLGALMRQLGETGIEIPDALGRAERSMNDARGALEARRPREAVGPQTNALDQLREGASAVIREMMEALSQDFGFSDDAGPFSRIGRDPFGRPQAGYGPIDDNSVKIPDQADVQRARDILRELYRRAGERTRPLLEREYIERLLRRF